MKAETLNEAISEITGIKNVSDEFAKNYALAHYLELAMYFFHEFKMDAKRKELKEKNGIFIKEVQAKSKRRREVFKSSISPLDQKKIIHFYKTEKDNRITTIQQKFGYSKGAINALIDHHLSIPK